MDNNITVSFDIDDCHFTLVSPKFIHDLTLVKLKKLFELMCKDSYRNEQTITIIEQHIEQSIIEAKAHWHDVSVTYQNDYVDTKCRYELSMSEKRVIERKNQKMFAAVKSAKSAYERMVKIKETFNATKQKFSV